MKANIEQMTEEEYHSDPCEMPSLSASIATVLDRQSPLHAYDVHPRLGGGERKISKSYDAGSIAHKLILGEGAELQLIVADDWRTKAARELRDAARADGKIPVLEKDHEWAVLAATSVLTRFADYGIKLEGRSEVSVFWEETTDAGEIVQCRGRMDHLLAPRIIDLKSSRSAHPEACQRHVDAYGYSIQEAAYTSAIESVLPQYAGRVEFMFVFFELAAPFAVTPVKLSGEFAALGRRKWRRAVETWARCLKEKDWPAYTKGVVTLEPPQWSIMRDMQREAEEADAAE